ncbi:hypothetical protein [Pseudonocardia xishanensis]
MTAAQHGAPAPSEVVTNDLSSLPNFPAEIRAPRARRPVGAPSSVY